MPPSIVFEHPEAPPMGVYFVYRSHYEGPSGKHVRALEAESVVGWFQGVWERAKAAEDAAAWVEAELGTSVYGFASLFEAARDESLPPPKTDRVLKSYLEEHLYVEGEVKYKPHVLQVLTDDDEIELAYFFFDDHYHDAYPGRAAYLLHEEWRLPNTSGDATFRPGIETKEISPPGAGTGTTYLAFLAFYDSLNLTDLDVEGPCRIEGVRLPQLCDFLTIAEPDERWPFELRLLRSQIPPSDPTEDRLRAALGRATRFPVGEITNSMNHSRWGLGTVDQARSEFESVLERSAVQAGRYDPSKSLLGVGDHIAQLCLHVGWEGEMYHQWIIFDDLWAGGHPDLAEGILRYAKRWDVLTV